MACSKDLRGLWAVAIAVLAATGSLGWPASPGVQAQLLPPAITDLAPEAHWIVADLWCQKTDDYTAIWEIQGDGQRSPLEGQELNDVRGVITADFQRGSGGPSELRGFFIQAHETDCNASTSDGVFVFTGYTAKPVTVGDVVQIAGTKVVEYGGPFTEEGSRTLTELTCYSACSITPIWEGLGLPPSVDLDPPADSSDYFEAREGMVAEIRATATVVGPSNHFNEAVVVRGAGADRAADGDPGRIIIDGDAINVAQCGNHGLPDVQVFDELPRNPNQGQALAGVIHYSFGADKLHLDPSRGCPAPTSGDDTSYHPDDNPAPAGDDPSLTVATMNMENFFLSSAAEKSPKLAAAICDPAGLAAPDVIGVQEIQNDDVLAILAADIEALCGVQYAHAARSSADPRGIENGYLVRVDQATLQSVELHQGCTDTYRGVRRSGNSDVTCGGATPYFLHNRPPLEAIIQTASGDTVSVLNVHFKSKLSSDNCADADCTDFRVDEAHHVVELVQERTAAGTSVIVLGDFNDGVGTDPLAVLTDSGLVDLWDDLPGPPSSNQGDNRQYSHIYQGQSSALDHILVTGDLAGLPRDFSPRHLNADWPESMESDPGSYRFSDHDPLVAAFEFN